MGTVSVDTPKTPATAGSGGVAVATLPNVCKMPGPPAPFVPTPLPNVGSTGEGVKNYSKNVTFDGDAIAIRGASFGSKGDMASKATGGGIASQNTHGPTKFIGPGSFTVKVEGKSVHLLGEPTLNNCGPSGSPANSATLNGLVQYVIPYGADYFEDGTCDACGKGYFDHPFVASDAYHPTGRYVRAVLAELMKEHRTREHSRERSFKALEYSARLSPEEKKNIRNLVKKLRTNSSKPAIASRKGCMIGAMMCESHKSQVFVAMSGTRASPQSTEFERIVQTVKEDGKTFIPIPLTRSVIPRDFFRANAKLGTAQAQANFYRKWDMTEKQRGRLKCAGPGVCAGARLLTHRGHQPVAMTEAFFAPFPDSPRVTIYRVRDGVILPEFGHEDLVPSCAACQILLPFALCDKRPTC